eukprot:CAMPEP_0194045052 /NCGR_PEP_ID=MMETSP0009_2-20130614/16429_1 /TAXON_ID=210454 /ORGANISM="Grammatophora oceanica, Strain CCMP 410" /LENGTH=130 /DNA_ID=CAMNT_0038689779 /DNA_START=78 /DNA_END=470 /DNA_ORIENTATION=-
MARAVSRHHQHSVDSFKSAQDSAPIEFVTPHHRRETINNSNCTNCTNAVTDTDTAAADDPDDPDYDSNSNNKQINNRFETSFHRQPNLPFLTRYSSPSRFPFLWLSNGSTLWNFERLNIRLVKPYHLAQP